MATTYAIKWLKDKLGVKFFPVTHLKAVRDDNNIDLDVLLGRKQNTLVSGTNIKTINDQSILGSGNIEVPVPTKTSDLTNDSGFITSSDIPEGSAASTTIPLMDGTASVGTEMAFARGDHRHPSDTSKQDVISDLADIRSGAEAGATAYQKPSTGIPKTDLVSAVQTSLGRADTALQSESDPVFGASAASGITSSDISNWNSKTSNVGTITGVSVNGTSIATSGVANITSVPANILSGAIKNGVTATTQASGDNSTKVATTAYVDTAINNLPEPMIFKGSLGTGGTITSLPAASVSNTGFTYKVITAGTYASQAAKVGDTFISDGSAWILIPSGDEPSGTVTSITLKANSPISIDSTAAITTSGTRTISHSTSGVTAGTYTKVTVDTYGHVTVGASLAASDIPNLDAAKITSGTVDASRIPLATSSARGGVKVGYTTNDKNYAVQLSNEQMYVNVPWTDHYAWSDITDKPINFKAYSGSLASDGWKTMQGKSSSPSIAISYNKGAASWNSGTYSATLVYGCNDTRGLLDCAHNTPIVTFGGCSYNTSDDNNPTWYMKISGTNGTTYNLNSMPYAASAGSVAWSNVSDKPTTLSGYGITDAKIANGTITLGNNSITPLTSHQSLAGYLPLSGGVLTGKLTIPTVHRAENDTRFNGGLELREYNNSTTSVSELGDGPGITFHWGGRYARLLAMSAAGQLYFGGSQIWNAGNDGSDSGLDADLLDGQHASAFALASNLSNYLPLSGGTMTGNITMGKNAIVFNLSNDTSWNVGASSGLKILNALSTSVPEGAFSSYAVGLSVMGYYGFQIGSAGSESYPYLAYRQIWRSDSGSSWRYLVPMHPSDNYDMNELRTYGGMYRLSEAPTNAFANAAYGNTLVVGSGSDTCFQLGAPYSSSELYFRTGTWKSDGTGSIRTNSWKQVAFTDSNVASTTKLQTPRTLWGQSFDGTGNVSGALTDTSSIRPSESVTYSIGSDSLAYKYVYAIWVGSPTNKILQFGANNQNHITVTTNGNVGVGTTSPATKLDVNGAVKAKNFSANGTDVAPFYSSSTTLCTNVNADLLDGYHASSFPRITTGTLAANGKIRVTFSQMFSAIISIRGSGGVQHLVLIGTGYGANTARNSWQQLSKASSTIKWSVPESDSISMSVEIENTGSQANNVYVTQFTPGTCTITSISTMTTAGDNNPLMDVGSSQIVTGFKNFIGNLGVSTYLFMGYNAEGIYLTSSGIWWHNSANTGTRPLIRFTSDGNVGISTDSPKTKLDVRGGILLGTNNNHLYVTDTNGNTIAAVGMDSSNYFLLGYGAAHNGYTTLLDGNELRLRYGTSHNTGIILNSSGNVGIGITSPSQRLHVYGNILATGEVTAYSDIRLKKNIKPLQVRGELKPMTYEKDGKQSIGFIAQDVQEIYPELVTEQGEDKMLSLNYAQLTAVLQAEILELKEEIKKLKNNK